MVLELTGQRRVSRISQYHLARFPTQWKKKNDTSLREGIKGTRDSYLKFSNFAALDLKVQIKKLMSIGMLNLDYFIC